MCTRFRFVRFLSSSFWFAGNYHWWNPLGGGDVSFDLGSQDLLKALGCMVLSGPFLTGYTQVLTGKTLYMQPSLFFF